MDGATRDFIAYYPYAAIGTGSLYAVGVTVTSTVTDWASGNGPEGETGNAE